MRDDRGETLLELLIALTILGVAVVAVVGGLSAGIMLSDVHRKQATAGVAVRDYAEAIVKTTAAIGGYVDCATVTTYQSPSGFSVPTGFTPSVVAGSMRYWNGTAWQASCPGTGDTGLQRLTLQVASVDGRATERLDLVVRKPCGLRLNEPLCS
jgi:hypothetical protein